MLSQTDIQSLETFIVIKSLEHFRTLIVGE